MDNFIKRVNEFNKFQLIDLAIAQRKELIELNEKLESQIQLNSNLIKISVERKNKERNLPAKDPGFRVTKWIETDQIVSGEIIRCFKIKILTPYEVKAFNYRVLNFMMDSIMGNLADLIGDFTVCESNEVRINRKINPDTNWVWNITFEADVERDRIDMNFYCSKMPIIDLS